MDVQEKREKEIRTIRRMISIYCHGQHHEREDKKGLCPSCQALNEYAEKRTMKCPRMEVKTFCNQCPIHCYSKEKQEEIRNVMRYSGPRILFVYPGEAVRHMVCTVKAKSEV